MKNFAFASAAAAALLQALSALAQGSGLMDSLAADYGIPAGMQPILESNKSRWRYPTDYTRNILPKFIHSHNDYWRDVPFYTALSVGAVSIEADIWLKNGTLYVGHEESALSPERTLESLYLEPIMDVLTRQNPKSDFVSYKTYNGVFDTDGYQTLYLWLDCKTAGGPTFKAAIEALEPLHKAGYLTTYSKTYGVLYGAVTVIGTGNTPLNAVRDVAPRYYFWDAPLNKLQKGRDYDFITAAVSPIASVDFATVFPRVGRYASGQVLSDGQLETLREQIEVAKKKGIGARYWDTPGWPVAVRNGVWRTLWQEGAMLINVDDVVSAAFGRW